MPELIPILNAIRPSSADRWMVCPGSVALTKDIPDPGSEFAAEGTKAHALAELCLRENLDADQPEGDWSEEMRGYVQEYLNYVDAIADGRKIYVEQTLKLDPYIPGRTGTADAVVIVDTVLHIIDLKYGSGVRVSAQDNKQLMIYALAAYTALSRTREIELVEMHIVQPRVHG